MTLPTFVGADPWSAGIGDIVVSLPTGWAVDDIHLLVVEQSAVNAFAAAPAGWTLVTGFQLKPASTATDACISVFWRRAVAGDTNPTVTDTGNHTSGQIFGFRGCITSGNPWDVLSTGTSTTSSTTSTVPGATTTVADCLVFIVYGSGIDVLSETEFSGQTNGDLANLTERADNMSSNGNGGGFGVTTGEKASIGAYGNTTVTHVNATTKAYGTIALKPAPAPSVTFFQANFPIILNTEAPMIGY